jgi:uncharacterized protein (DUF1684 family)
MRSGFGRFSTGLSETGDDDVRHPNQASWVLVLSLVLACAQDPLETGRTRLSVGPGVPPDDEAAWKAELLEERAEKDEEFATSETSPMAGKQYLKSEPAKQVFLTREDKTFALAYEGTTGSVLSMTLEDGLWTWQALDQDAVCRREGETVPSGSPLDGPVVFSVRDLRLSFHPAEDRVTFIVFDRERDEMKAFEHLRYFPPAPAYAVHAELVPYGEPEALVVATSRNLEKTFYRYATLRFRLDGEDRELTALKYALEGESSTVLFIPFRDATSGRQTYGAGRFLEIEEPAESFFVLDFNRAFNPLCNYSPAYNCALPPPENRLEVPVLAGEKTYPH